MAGEAREASRYHSRRSRLARIVPAAAAVLVMAAGTAACGRSVVSLPGVGTVKKSNNGKTYTYSNSHGSYSMSGAQKLPSGFPRDVPLPAGGRVSGSESAGSGGQMEYMVYFIVNGNPQGIESAYQSRLQQAGYRISGTSSTDGTYMVGAQGPQWAVEAVATNGSANANANNSGLEPGQSMLELILSDRGSGSTTTTSAGNGG